jgi:glycine betaine catabolism B
MSTTSSHGPIFDARFAKRIVMVCGLVPAILLVWDAIAGQLGVNDVNFAIRTTGLLGLIFLTLSLCVTPLRRLTGWNAWIAVRRNLGVYGFAYIAAHFLIFFAFDRSASVASTIEEIIERVYLWFGAGALLAMIPLAATSTDAMVTRLGPRRWKRLHLLAYLAVLGGVVHYYLLVKADVRNPLIFAGLFAGLMVYRGARHYLDLRAEIRAIQSKLVLARKATGSGAKRPFWSGELVVARIFQETPDVKTFRLVPVDGGPLPFVHISGQYLTLALMISGKRVNRSYTIASSPTRNGSCEISVKRAVDGYASHYLHDEVVEGSRLKVSAPGGRFVFAGGEEKRVVLIAGGVGITPMMSVVRSLTDRCWPGEIFLLFSVRTAADIVFGEELRQLQSRFPTLHVRVTLTAASTAPADSAHPVDPSHATGHITAQMISELVPGLSRGPVLLCGPEAMMVAMRTIVVQLGVPDAEVLEEAFVSPATATTAAVADSAGADASGSGARDNQPAELESAPRELLQIRFQRTGASVEIASDLSVLEAAEDNGIELPFECRSGICGQCKTKLISGRVRMEVEDALTVTDRKRGLILACQARALDDIVVDL